MNTSLLIACVLCGVSLVTFILAKDVRVQRTSFAAFCVFLAASVYLYFVK